MAKHSSRNVWLVQQGVWDMAVASMPLAIGYLKATADSDDAIRSEVDTRIWNFHGGDTAKSMLAIRYMPGTSYIDMNHFSPRPLFLVRGEDRTGRNDFHIYHEWEEADAIQR